MNIINGNPFKSFVANFIHENLIIMQLIWKVIFPRVSV